MAEDVQDSEYSGSRDVGTGSRLHFTLKSNFLLVNLFCFIPISDKETSFFLGIFYTRSILYKNCINLIFRAFSEANFLADIEELAHMLISSLSTIFQVTNNLLTSMIDENFNIRQTKSQFLSNHQMIRLRLHWSK